MFHSLHIFEPNISHNQNPDVLLGETSCTKDSIHRPTFGSSYTLFIDQANIFTPSSHPFWIILTSSRKPKLPKFYFWLKSPHSHLYHKRWTQQFKTETI